MYQSVIWGARDDAEQQCTECSRFFDAILVDDDDGVFLCRDCYEQLTYRDRIRFVLSMSRWPSLADFPWRISVRSLYGGGGVVYCILWALRAKGLPPALARTIVEAPIQRIETPSWRCTQFFGRARGPVIHIDADGCGEYHESLRDGARGVRVRVHALTDGQWLDLEEFNDGFHIVAIRQNTTIAIQSADECIRSRRVVYRRRRSSGRTECTLLFERPPD